MPSVNVEKYTCEVCNIPCGTVLSMIMPLVPPLAARVAVVALGSDPPSVVGMLKDIRQPALVGQFTGDEVEPND